MTQNTSPIFGGTPISSFATLAANTTGNFAMDGTGTVTTVFTAGTNGSFIKHIGIRWAGAISNNNQSSWPIIRVFLNNGAVNSTATHNTFISEYLINNYLPTNSTSGNGMEIPLYFSLPASWNINIVVNSSVPVPLAFTVWGSNY